MTATLIQSKAATVTGNVTNITVTPTSVFTAGNLAILVVPYAHGVSRTIASVQDQSNTAFPTYTTCVSLFDSGTSAGVHIVVIENIPSSTTAMKVTLSGNADFYLAAAVYEWSGLSSVSPIDSACSLGQITQFFGSGTDQLTSTFGTNTKNPALLFGFAWNLSNSANTPSNGTGFTNITTVPDSANAQKTEYKRITNIGSQAATFTTANDGNWHIATMLVLGESSNSIPIIMNHRINQGMS